MMDVASYNMTVHVEFYIPQETVDFIETKHDIDSDTLDQLLTDAVRKDTEIQISETCCYDGLVLIADIPYSDFSDAAMDDVLTTINQCLTSYTAGE